MSVAQRLRRFAVFTGVATTATALTVAVLAGPEQTIASVAGFVGSFDVSASGNAQDLERFRLEVDGSEYDGTSYTTGRSPASIIRDFSAQAAGNPIAYLKTRETERGYYGVFADETAREFVSVARNPYSGKTKVYHLIDRYEDGKEAAAADLVREAANDLAQSDPNAVGEGLERLGMKPEVVELFREGKFSYREAVQALANKRLFLEFHQNSPEALPEEDRPGFDLADVPRFPGSVRVKSLELDHAIADSRLAGYVTRADGSDVIAWYMNRLPSLGWSTRSDVTGQTQQNRRGDRTLFYRRGADSIQISVMAMDSGATGIFISELQGLL